MPGVPPHRAVRMQGRRGRALVAYDALLSPLLLKTRSPPTSLRDTQKSSAPPATRRLVTLFVGGRCSHAMGESAQRPVRPRPVQ